MKLNKKIKKAYVVALIRNGSPRLDKDQQVAGTTISQLTVVRHIKTDGLHSKSSKRFKVTTECGQFMEQS